MFFVVFVLPSCPASTGSGVAGTSASVKEGGGQWPKQWLTKSGSGQNQDAQCNENAKKMQKLVDCAVFRLGFPRLFVPLCFEFLDFFSLKCC